MAKYKRGGISHLKLASILFVVISLPLIVLAVKTQTNTKSEASVETYSVYATAFYDVDGDWTNKGEDCWRKGLSWQQDGKNSYVTSSGGCNTKIFKTPKGKCTTLSYTPPSGMKETGISYATPDFKTKSGKQVAVCRGGQVLFGFKNIKQPLNY